MIASFVLALLGGCSSAGSGSHASGHIDGTSPSAPSNKYPNDHLTGFGATVQAFTAKHPVNNDGSTAKGCCYGSTVTLASGERTAEYNVAANQGPLIIDLTRSFSEGTDESAALNEIADDLPADAVRGRSMTKDQCRVFVFASKTLAESAPVKDLGREVSVFFYPPVDPLGGDAPYDASSVEQAIFGSGGDTSVSC